MMRLYHGTALIAWDLVQRRGLLPYNQIGRRVHAALDQPLILQPFVHLTTDPLIASLYAGGLPIPDMDADVEDYVGDLLATGEGVRATREGLILAVDVGGDEIAEWEFEPGKFYEDEEAGEWLTDRVPPDRLIVVAHIAVGS